MKMKKLVALMAVCASLTGMTFFAGNTAAYAAETAQGDAEKANIWFQYKSIANGFTIDCPQLPVGVLYADALFEGKEGEILVFQNEGFHIQHAWVILRNAYTDKEIPDMTKASEAEQQAVIDRLLKNGYEYVRIADIDSPRFKTKGVYAVTAKELEIDTNGDGKPDTVAKADSQMIETYFPGEQGGHFEFILIDNPDLKEEHVKNYQAAVGTFHELSAKEKEDLKAATDKAKEEAKGNNQTQPAAK